MKLCNYEVTLRWRKMAFLAGSCRLWSSLWVVLIVFHSKVWILPWEVIMAIKMCDLFSFWGYEDEVELKEFCLEFSFFPLSLPSYLISLSLILWARFSFLLAEISAFSSHILRNLISNKIRLFPLYMSTLTFYSLFSKSYPLDFEHIPSKTAP